MSGNQQQPAPDSSADGSYDRRYKDVYDREAASYDESRFGSIRPRYAKQIKNDLIVRLLEENNLLNTEANLLDVASGTGRIAHDLIRNDLWRIYAADISGQMLRQSKKKLDPRFQGRMSWTIANMKDLPFPGSFFDVATLGSFLYLIPLEEYAKYVADIRRVLKDSGLLICEVSNACGLLNPKNTAVVVLEKYWHRRKVKSYVTPWGLKHLFPGFEVQEIIGVEYPLVSRSYDNTRRLSHRVGRLPLLRYLGGKFVLVMRKK